MSGTRKMIIYDDIGYLPKNYNSQNPNSYLPLKNIDIIKLQETQDILNGFIKKMKTHLEHLNMYSLIRNNSNVYNFLEEDLERIKTSVGFKGDLLEKINGFEFYILRNLKKFRGLPSNLNSKGVLSALVQHYKGIDTGDYKLTNKQKKYIDFTVKLKQELDIILGEIIVFLEDYQVMLENKLKNLRAELILFQQQIHNIVVLNTKKYVKKNIFSILKRT